MPKIYYNLVVKGERKFKDVPKDLEEAVKKILIENGYEHLL